MNVILVDSESSTWATELDQVYRALGGANNPQLFPYHFLQTTLPRIGGHVALWQKNNTLQGAGFLFPRLGLPDHPSYTLRLHRLSAGLGDEMTPDYRLVAAQLGNPEITLYLPEDAHHFDPTHTGNGVVDIGCPDASEAEAIRALQQQVWGSAPGYLYPADMHSVEFGLGTSLVARIDKQPVGFLFGFDKIGAEPLPSDWQARFHGERRIESQTLGVLPAYRGARLGFLLKRMQAELALQRGIQVINWTVDPLQWPNAQLNFGQLRAVAFDFMPDYYAFRNELNRLPASRFGITWLINTPRVASGLNPRPESQPYIRDLRAEAAILRINQGWQQVAEPGEAPHIAIEIPANWTALQRDNLAEAARWRSTTDQILQRYIGRQPGQYVVTEVGANAEQRFLIAERVTELLWSRMAESVT